MTSIQLSRNPVPFAHRTRREHDETMMTMITRGNRREAAAMYADLATALMCGVPVHGNASDTGKYSMPDQY
jgi:hypothetical protein